MKHIFCVFLISSVVGVRAHVGLVNPYESLAVGTSEEIAIQWQVFVAHVSLDWDLYFSADSGQTWEVIAEDIPLNELSYTWTTPDTAVAHAMIRIVQDNEGADYDDKKLFVISDLSNVKGGNDISLFELYPNPASEAVFIKSRTYSNLHFSIYNSQGKKIAEFEQADGANSTRLITSDFPSGIYYIRFRSDGVIRSGKLVIANP